MNVQFFWYGLLAIVIWGTGLQSVRALPVDDEVDVEVTFIHDGPTTRQNVLVEVNGAYGGSINSNHLSSTALVDSSLEFRHEYRYGEPGSDFPGLIRVESDFDVDQLTVRVISNFNLTFSGTEIKLAFSDLKSPYSDTLTEEVLSDVRLLSLSSNTGMFDLIPFTVATDFSQHGITIDLQNVHLIGGTTTAVFDITTSRIPEPTTILLLVGAVVTSHLWRMRFPQRF